MTSPALTGVEGLLPGHPLEDWEFLADSLTRSSSDWAVLVGAGLSRGAGLPDWSLLTARAVERFAVPAPERIASENLPLALQDCEASDPAEFWTFVMKELCREPSPSRAQHLLCQLPFELLATLNYDRLLEAPWMANRHLPSDPIVWYPDLPPAKLSAQRLVYLHGRCPGGTADCLSSEKVVLTQDSYFKAYSQSSALATAVASIFQSYNVLLVGTSLSDPDIGHILRELGRLRALTSAPSSRTHLAFVGTTQAQYQVGMHLAYPGYANAIRPLWYHTPPESGDHNQLTVLLESLVRRVTT